MVQQVGHLLGNNLNVLRRGLAAIDGGGHAAGGAELGDFGALHLGTRIGFQCDRFHVVNFKIVFGRRSTGAPALKFKQGVHRRITMNPLDGFTQKPRHGQRGYLHTVNRRALDCISCYQFVNGRIA